MTIATRPPRHSFRFRGRNFLALVLKPETPRVAWLADLDQWLARSPGFFTGKPLILDLAGLDFALGVGEEGGAAVGGCAPGQACEIGRASCRERV